MSLAQSHLVPAGSIPESAMREHLSEAYLQMIASAAGLTVGEWGDDYDGVDATLKSKVDYSPGALGPKIDIQLKCTGQERAVRADSIAWSLETRTIEFLRAPHRSNPALFCVLVAPEGPGSWLRHDISGLLAKSHMYWLWGHNYLHLPTNSRSKRYIYPRQISLIRKVFLS